VGNAPAKKGGGRHGGGFRECAKRFERVREAFAANFDKGEVGAAWR
jgi:hypothetical protein